jgi:hypothetical protein
LIQAYRNKYADRSCVCKLWRLVVSFRFSDGSSTSSSSRRTKRVAKLLCTTEDQQIPLPTICFIRDRLLCSAEWNEIIFQWKCRSKACWDFELKSRVTSPIRPCSRFRMNHGCNVRVSLRFLKIQSRRKFLLFKNFQAVQIHATSNIL